MTRPCQKDADGWCNGSEFRVATQDDMDSLPVGPDLEHDEIDSLDD